MPKHDRLDDGQAFDAMLALREGEELSTDSLRAFANWADAQYSDVCWLRAELAAAKDAIGALMLAAAVVNAAAKKVAA